MEYIRVTKDNLEKEHICCAISNNKDVQVSSKKAWLADRFDEGLVFSRVWSGESALLSISQLRMHGFQSMPMDICISTACGYPDPLRDMDTLRTY